MTTAEGDGELCVGQILHQSVAPERWCITKADLKEFKARVMTEWRKGNIPPNPKRYNKSHYDKLIGPSFYQVVKHYVKPVTKSAGSMSYALMKHARGLPCEIFVTHAWAEGVFEFVDKVLLAWPHGRDNLWCCVLALPQNLDIGNLLDVALEETPFARALHMATHVVVVPNQSASIYKRLWCVYEAFRSVEEDKVLTMPVKIRWRQGLPWLALAYALPLSLGNILGLVLWACFFADRQRNAPPDEPVLDQREGKVIDMSARVLLAVSVTLLSLSVLCRVHHFRGPPLCLHFLLAIAYPAVAILWLNGRLAVHDQNPWEWLVMGVIAVARVSSLFIDIHRWLEEDEMERLRGQLSFEFESVQRAKCANPVDERRIREAIAGREKDVDEVVQVLMEAGTYTEELRQAHSDGVDIRGLGHMSYATSTCLAATLWVVNAMLLAERSAYLDGEASIKRWRVKRLLAGISVFGALLSAVYLVTFAVRKMFRPTRTDRAQLIVRTWSWSAVASMLAILLGLGFPHVLPQEARGRPQEDPFPFLGIHVLTPVKYAIVVLVPPGLALISALDTWRQRAIRPEPHCVLASRRASADASRDADASSEGEGSDEDDDCATSALLSSA